MYNMLQVTTSQETSIAMYLKQYVTLYTHVLVTLQPSGDTVRALHGNVLYACVWSTNEYIGFHWLINGTDLEMLSLPGITRSNGGTTGVLAIPVLTEMFNSTTLQCKLSLASGVTLSSPISQIRLQGTCYPEHTFIILFCPPATLNKLFYKSE